MVRRSYLERQSTSELLCLPFLDTDVSEEVPIADEILRARGYPPRVIRFLRILCCIGLWHQFLFMWDWASLSLWDVIQGYAVPLAVIGVYVGMIFSLSVGLTLLATGVAAFFGAYVGMSWSRKRFERKMNNSSDSN